AGLLRLPVGAGVVRAGLGVRTRLLRLLRVAVPGLGRAGRRALRGRWSLRCSEATRWRILRCSEATRLRRLAGRLAHQRVPPCCSLIFRHVSGRAPVPVVCAGSDSCSSQTALSVTRRRRATWPRPPLFPREDRPVMPPLRAFTPSSRIARRARTPSG